MSFALALVSKRVCFAIAWAFALSGAHAQGVPGDAHPAAGKTATPQEVLALVESHGVSEAVVSLDKSGAWLSSVLPGVAAARADWLGVARVLTGGTDAGGSEELEDALSEALLKAPYRVLPLLQEIWWKDERTPPCTYGWDSELPGGVEPYVRRLREALNAPAPAKLAPLREACLRGIEATLRDVKENEAHPEDGR